MVIDMKFLLAAINAKYIHSNPAVYSLRAYAMEHIAAGDAGSRKEGGKSIEIAEYTINQKTDEILADIFRRQPDIIGISCYIWNIAMVRELLAELPKLLPDVPIWLGGPEVSWQPEQLMDEYPKLTGIMLGEGEGTFPELVNYYLTAEKQAGACLEHIRGIYSRDGYSGERPPLDMDSLPFYYKDLGEFTNRIIYYESSRGCPYRCSYCLSSVEKSLRLRSMGLVEKELDFFLEQKAAQVKFIDRTFNCNHEHAQAIWKHILECDNGVTNFHFEIAADILNDVELNLLKEMRPGLVQLEIGVQSTNLQTLSEINRSASFEKISENVRRIWEGQNIHLHLDLIAGLPYEDYESFQKSFCQVYGLRPEQLQLGFLKVLKGTQIYKKAADYGIVYRSKAPYEVLYTKWLPYEQTLKLKRVEEMLEIYYNSNQFTHILPVLELSFAHPFALYEALAEYYEDEGHFVNTPSRTYRYEVLLQFACKTDMMKKELYRQLLTYDLYLRENLKSRPAFSKDLNIMKNEIRIFYEKEEAERRYLPGYLEFTSRQVSRMTHIDIFDYPVWETDGKKAGRRLEQPCFVLFDYRIRNRLNKEAAVTFIPYAEIMGNL